MNNSYIITIIKDVYQFFGVCFFFFTNSGKLLLSGYQMMCVFSQNFVFSWMCHKNPRFFSLEFYGTRFG